MHMPMLAPAGRFSHRLSSPAAGVPRLVLWAKICSRLDGMIDFYHYKEHFPAIRPSRRCAGTGVAGNVPYDNVTMMQRKR